MFVTRRAQAAIEQTLKHEGGYVDHPADPGGATNWGISLRFYRANIDSSATKITIQKLPRARAVEIYFEFFWRDWFDDTPIGFAEQVFDMAVNAGYRTALRVAQRALSACTPGRLLDDGIFGPKTRNAIDRAGPGLVCAYKSERAGYYRLLAATRPDLEVFLEGWLNRAYS